MGVDVDRDLMVQPDIKKVIGRIRNEFVARDDLQQGEALQFGNPGDRVWVRIPLLRRDVRVICGNSVVSRAVLVGGGYCWSDKSASPLIKVTDEFNVNRTNNGVQSGVQSGKIKYLYSVVEGSARVFYVAGWRSGFKVQVASVPLDQTIAGVALANLGGNDWQVDLITRIDTISTFYTYRSDAANTVYTFSSFVLNAPIAFGHGFYHLTPGSTTTSTTSFPFGDEGGVVTVRQGINLFVYDNELITLDVIRDISANDEAGIAGYRPVTDIEYEQLILPGTPNLIKNIIYLVNNIVAIVTYREGWTVQRISQGARVAIGLKEVATNRDVNLPPDRYTFRYAREPDDSFTYTEIPGIDNLPQYLDVFDTGHTGIDDIPAGALTQTSFDVTVRQYDTNLAELDDSVLVEVFGVEGLGFDYTFYYASYHPS